MLSEPLALGIDIGGSTTKIGIVDASGRILASDSARSELTKQAARAYLGRVLEIAQGLLRKSPSPVSSAGISLIGAVSEGHGGTLCAVNGPGLQGLDLRAMFATSLGLPVYLTNDLTAHALAEYWFGIGAGSRRFLCLALGTGLGAGVVIDGSPVMHWGGTAGDTGRIILEPRSPFKCDGGVRGSAEALCGTAAVERMAEEGYGRPVRCAEVIRAAQSGNDPIAARIFQEIGKHLGHLLAILAVVYFPSRVALSGGIAEAGPALLEACISEFDALIGDYFHLLEDASRGYCTSVQISKGLLGADAAMIGAACRALKANSQDDVR